MPTKLRKISGGVCAPHGFTAAAISAGIKYPVGSRDDMALVASSVPCVAAGTFTTNKVKAAPVLASTKHLLSKTCRGVILNSGNANACTGQPGLADAIAMAGTVASVLSAKVEEILVCSTGRIGVPLPIEKMTAKIPALAAKLDTKSSTAAAKAIMTSDTVSKESAREFVSGGTKFRVGGLAKGAGMIDPNMATMLCVITTDAAFPKAELRKMIKLAVERSFNRITIDGDMSTNDTVLLLASGVQGRPDAEDFQAALDAVALELAHKIVLDGEGVSRFIEVEVRGAKSVKDARVAAEAVANSTLTKCAWAGGDPNWGRILDAVGYSGAALDPDQVSIDYDKVPAVRNGMPARTPFARLQAVAAKKAFKVTVDLHHGKATYTVFTTDLTEDYVKFNLGE
ncbi:MAG TPA: bifunctional glutamate N-acetyltransferase/amino-acid acetyltransferase ArgJ [Chthoniobacterales bacterium]|nr:bifunctional glutamate N-acetyltransferase/amino-acid acetyltransferase ArgJ [Chthoniobacterales bacterium]